MFFYLFLYATFFLNFHHVSSFFSRLDFKFSLANDFEIEREYNSIYQSNADVTSQYNDTIQFIDQYFIQKLDHSRPTDNRTWYQRYFVNDLFYEEGGPVFLFIFGESQAKPKWMSRGPQWISYAKKSNAFCFGLEHRFYGKSRPTENTKFSNLQYLTTEQVLADIAYFIEGMNEMYNFSSDIKWILFGGSYAGSLAAWARMKYPHLVFGVVASSAPLLAKTDFPEYFQVVEKSLKKHSSECAKNIAIANRQLKRAVQTASGRAKASKIFKLCNVLINDSNDIATLFKMLARGIAFAVQYNSKIFSIKDVCDIMNNDKHYPLRRYANVNAAFSKLLNESTCFSSEYSDIVKYWRNETFISSSHQSSRLWRYQTCTEYGFFQTSSKPNDLFGQYFPLNYFIKICKDVFGDKFEKSLVDDAVRRTNIEFGGLNFVNDSKVILIHGDVDPWHALGINQREKSALYHVIFIKGAAHCGDMYPSSNDDSEEVKAARRKIFAILKSWLENDDKSSNSTQETVNFKINDESYSVHTQPKMTLDNAID